MIWIYKYLLTNTSLNNQSVVVRAIMAGNADLRSLWLKRLSPSFRFSISLGVHTASVLRSIARSFRFQSNPPA